MRDLESGISRRSEPDKLLGCNLFLILGLFSAVLLSIIIIMSIGLTAYINN